MKKSPDAFRTISEVSEWLETPAHVLRFWESRFSQVKPVKRAGGRRYYRPSDMLLLGGIKRLLHEDGMTIRGAQKVLREQGVKHVATLSQPLDTDADLDLTATEVALDGAPAEVEAPMAVDVPPEPMADDTLGGDNVVPLTLDTAQPALPLDDANDTVETPADDIAVAPDADPVFDAAPEEPPQEAAQAPEPAEEPTAADLPPVADDHDLPPLRLEPDSAAVESDVPAPAPTPDDDAVELRPLGANLPKHDPDDDDDSFIRHMPPPLTIQLRDRVVRLKLSQEHHDEINSAVSRLNALQDRMSNGG